VSSLSFIFEAMFRKYIVLLFVVVITGLIVYKLSRVQDSENTITSKSPTCANVSEHINSIGIDLKDYSSKILVEGDL
jgi:hypothetical protein